MTAPLSPDRLSDIARGLETGKWWADDVRDLLAEVERLAAELSTWRQMDVVEGREATQARALRYQRDYARAEVDRLREMLRVTNIDRLSAEANNETACDERDRAQEAMHVANEEIKRLKFELGVEKARGDALAEAGRYANGLCDKAEKERDEARAEAEMLAACCEKNNRSAAMKRADSLQQRLDAIGEQLGFTGGDVDLIVKTIIKLQKLAARDDEKRMTLQHRLDALTGQFKLQQNNYALLVDAVYGGKPPDFECDPFNDAARNASAQQRLDAVVAAISKMQGLYARHVGETVEPEGVCRRLRNIAALASRAEKDGGE